MLSPKFYTEANGNLLNEMCMYAPSDATKDAYLGPSLTC